MYQLHPYQQKMVNQARSKLAQGKKSVMLVSPPGSGKSVMIGDIASLVANKGGYVLFLVHRKELKEQIANTFAKFEIPIAARTIETVIKVKNHLGQYPQPTLIITDETHHAKAKTYQEIYDYYKDVPKLGFTATPWRLSGEGFNDTYDTMIQGPTVQWLIDNHFLAPFHYYAAAKIDRSKLKKSSTGDYTNGSMDLAFGADFYGDSVDVYRQYADNRQAIVYAHSVVASQHIAQAFNNAGVVAVHADAKTPKKEREQIMADFRTGKIKVLSNVDLISEGFDVPDCGVVILARPTKSLVLFLQQSMRGMRYQPDKQSVIIDRVGNVLEHGLPTDEHDWSLEGRKKKEFMRPIVTCLFCQATFYKDMAKKTQGGQVICPVCGKAQPVDERGEKTEKETDTDVEFVDLQTEKGRLMMLAKKKPKQQKTISSIYKVLDAQKITGIGNTQYPIPRTLHIMLDKHPEGISHADLDELALLTGKQISSIENSYSHALASHKSPEQRKAEWQANNNIAFNF